MIIEWEATHATRGHWPAIVVYLWYQQRYLSRRLSPTLNTNGIEREFVIRPHPDDPTHNHTRLYGDPWPTNPDWPAISIARTKNRTWRNKALAKARSSETQK